MPKRAKSGGPQLPHRTENGNAEGCDLCFLPFPKSVIHVQEPVLPSPLPHLKFPTPPSVPLERVVTTLVFPKANLAPLSTLNMLKHFNWTASFLIFLQQHKITPYPLKSLVYQPAPLNPYFKRIVNFHRVFFSTVYLQFHLHNKALFKVKSFWTPKSPFPLLRHSSKLHFEASFPRLPHHEGCFFFFFLSVFSLSSDSQFLGCRTRT